MNRLLAAFLALALALTACAEAEPTAPDPQPETTAVAPTTSTLATTTTTTTTTAPPPLPSDVTTRLGLGDSRYPELGNAGYDVAHYTIDLTFDPEVNTLSALVSIDATATEPIDAFSVDFVGFEVTAIKVNGEAVSFDRLGEELIIQLPAPLATGDDFVATIAYNGTPQPVLSQALPFEVGWRTDTAGTSYVVAEPDGGRSWLPLNDHPSDKATYTFLITVPEPLIAAANGTLQERITDLGWSTWVWESNDPMASYLATVVIGDLMVVPDETSTTESGVVVRNVLPRDLATDIPVPLERQGEMISFFAELFGPYPFEAYGIAVVGDFEAALENQTLSIFGRTFVEFPAFFETVLVHELAHQWFGNSVTPADWGDIWLNEGFATYAEWLWIEETRGAAAYQATVNGERNRLALVDLPPPGNPPAEDLFNASVYVWGGLTLHALRVEIGDDAFFETLRTYYATYENSIANTADFIAIAEAVSGADLTDLFDQWLYSAVVPELPSASG
ncbi:MAG: M1 family metallopeptidase [Acidimicrobiia bacterium]|nr:M1 family metallopeptidase [Acidimicrobiia bacterium]